MACINKTDSNPYIIELKYGHVCEYFVTVFPQNDEDICLLYNQVVTELCGQGAKIIHQNIFGMHYGDGKKTNKPDNIPVETGWPVTWLMESGNKNNGLGGIQIHAVSGVDVKRIKDNGAITGSFFEYSDTRYCRMGGILPVSGKPRTEQTRNVFQKIESMLLQIGMDFSHIGRTWIYLDNILDWYDPFNRARDEFFHELEVFGNLIPASTGIGGPNPAGTDLSAGALAVQGNGVTLSSVPSPYQEQPLKYGSSFSRAVEIKTSDYRLLLISGTASIDRYGKTVYAEDVKGQIGLTMEIVKAILVSRKMAWKDVIRGVAYFRYVEDTPLFKQFCSENHLPPLPIVVTHNEICRDNLLFELEIDAVTTY